MSFGEIPEKIKSFKRACLHEFMHYLYLPIKMNGRYKIPANLFYIRPIIEAAKDDCGDAYKYCYVTAINGIASPGNALNRPGWHCDGYGTYDVNYQFWIGAGTRYLAGKFTGIPFDDHLVSLRLFDELASQNPDKIFCPMDRTLYYVSPFVVHSAPEITQVEPRQYVKISFSDFQYNLEGNSHNYLFDYKWKMYPREVMRNDPHRAQRDYK